MPDINTIKDMQQYVEGCINDFELGLSTKTQTIKYLEEYIKFNEQQIELDKKIILHYRRKNWFDKLQKGAIGILSFVGGFLICLAL